MAASTIALFFIALPGMLFRIGYRKGGLEVARWQLKWPFVKIFPRRQSFLEHHPKGQPEDYPKNRRPMVEEVFQGLVIAVIFHAIWSGWIVKSFGYTVDRNLASKVILGTQLQPSEQSQLADQFGYILWYFLSLYAASYSLGRIGLVIVRKARLDLNTHFFRMRDEWFYIIRGNFQNFRENLNEGDPREEIFLTYCTMVIREGNTDWFYFGTVLDYMCDRDGELESLVLEDAARAPFDPNSGYALAEDSANGVPNQTSLSAAAMLDQPTTEKFANRIEIIARCVIVNIKGCKSLAFNYLQAAPKSGNSTGLEIADDSETKGEDETGRDSTTDLPA